MTILIHRGQIPAMIRDRDGEDFYVCPHHIGTGGYESCCNCEGWDENDPDYGRKCTDAVTRGDSIRDR